MLEQEPLDAGAELGVSSAGGVQILDALRGASRLKRFDEYVAFRHGEAGPIRGARRRVCCFSAMFRAQPRMLSRPVPRAERARLIPPASPAAAKPARMTKADPPCAGRRPSPRR